VAKYLPGKSTFCNHTANWLWPVISNLLLNYPAIMTLSACVMRHSKELIFNFLELILKWVSLCNCAHSRNGVAVQWLRVLWAHASHNTLIAIKGLLNFEPICLSLLVRCVCFMPGCSGIEFPLWARAIWWLLRSFKMRSCAEYDVSRTSSKRGMACTGEILKWGDKDWNFKRGNIDRNF